MHKIQEKMELALFIVLSFSITAGFVALERYGFFKRVIFGID